MVKTTRGKSENSSGNSGAESGASADGALGRGKRDTRRAPDPRGDTGKGSLGGIAASAIPNGDRPPGGKAEGKRVESARQIWGRVWDEFGTRRESDRTNAWLWLLRSLSKHGERFVPEFISPKDYAELIVHLESFIKQDVGAKEGSAIDKVRQFLSGDASITPTSEAVH